MPRSFDTTLPVLRDVNQSLLKSGYSILLMLIFALGIGLRVHDMTDAPIDFHPTRQLRGAIVARGIYYTLDPHADENTRQTAQNFARSVGQYEPPILETLVALTWLVLGEEQLWVARLYNTLFWALGGVALYALARKLTSLFESHLSTWVDRFAAAIVLAYYFVLPFSVQASRSFQPDPAMVVWIILFMYALTYWAEVRSWKWTLLSGLFGGMAILTKAVALYVVIASWLSFIIHLAYQSTHASRHLKDIFTEAIKLLFSPLTLCMGLLLIAPSGVFYLSRGTRASEYLSTWMVSLSHLLIEPWFYARWANLVQSLMGLIPLLVGGIGLFIARGRLRVVLIGLWGGYLAYGLSLPYQIYTHNYYHLMLVPILALSLLPLSLKAIQYLSTQPMYWKVAVFLLGVFVVAFYARVSIINFTSQDYRNEATYWQEIAAQLPQDGKIIALTQDYGMRLMYYGWRKVTLWPNRGEQNLAQLRGSEKEFEAFFNNRIEGMSFFLITAFRQFDDQPQLKEALYRSFPIYAQGEGYLIFDLRQPLNETTAKKREWLLSQ